MTTADKDGQSCFPRVPMKKMFSSKKHSSATVPHLRFDGKVAIIIGGASGIGAATARLLVAEGAKVVIADIKAAAGKKLGWQLGSSAQFVRCDVTNEADVAAAVEYAMQAWGNLDIMFNNAGVAGPLVGLADFDVADFDQVLAVHIKGAVLGVKHAARVMVPAGKGVILFSGGTSASGPALQLAASAAVLSIVRSAAGELVRHGIRVNAVSTSHSVSATPTSVATSKEATKSDARVEQSENLLAPSSKLDVLTAEKVAKAVLFLVSDDAGFISGHNIVLDGALSSPTGPFDSSNVQEQKAGGGAKVEPGRSPPALAPSKLPTASKEPAVVADAQAQALTEEMFTTKKTTSAAEKEKQKQIEEEKALKAKDENEKLKAQAKEEKERDKEEQERDQREKEKQIEEEKVRAKEEKARLKALAEKQKVEQKGEKESEKRKKAEQIEDEKARAKEEKARSRAAEDSKAPPAREPKNDDIHPLDKKASAKEERIRNENIESANAGPEPDIPSEFRARAPVKSIIRLLSSGKDKFKESAKSTDPDKVSKKESKGDNDSGNLGTASSKKEGKKPLAAKDEKTASSKDSPQATASSNARAPMQSAMHRIATLLGTGKDSGGKKKAQTDIQPTDSKKPEPGPQSPAMEPDNARVENKGWPRTAPSPEIKVIS